MILPPAGSTQAPRLMSVSMADSHAWASVLAANVYGAGWRAPLCQYDPCHRREAAWGVSRSDGDGKQAPGYSVAFG